MYAVNLNLVKVCTLFIEFNADVETQDNEGRTPLHIAASSNSPDVVPIICEGDCHLEEPDAEGDTALHIAVSMNHWEVVKALLQEGTNPSTQNEQVRPQQPQKSPLRVPPPTNTSLRSLNTASLARRATNRLMLRPG